MKVFASLPLNHFMQEVFEQKPHVFRGVLDDTYFSLSDLNAALSTSMTSALPFSMGLNGKQANPQDYSSVVRNHYKNTSRPEIDPHKVEQLLQLGANLKIQRFAAVSPKVRDLCLDVESWLGFATSANGYFSLGHQRGLPVHWDSHDLLVVQLMGAKNWKIYKPAIELPLRAHRSHVKLLPNADELFLEIELRAGDAVYIPRGWWHDVTPVPGVTTLHAAIGLHPPSVSDFMTWAMNAEVINDADLRRTLVRDGRPVELATVFARLSAKLASAEMREKYWNEYSASARSLDRFNLS